MIKVAKILGWTFLVLILLLAAGVTFTIGWRPFTGPRARPLTNFTFQSTPERLARGRYLVEDVTALLTRTKGATLAFTGDNTELKRPQ